MPLIAQSPALPLDDAGEYVAGAYIVFVVLLVIYIGLMAAKLARISRELDEIADEAERRASDSHRVRPEAEAREEVRS